MIENSVVSGAVFLLTDDFDSYIMMANATKTEKELTA